MSAPMQKSCALIAALLTLVFAAASLMAHTMEKDDARHEADCKRVADLTGQACEVLRSRCVCEDGSTPLERWKL